MLKIDCLSKTFFPSSGVAVRAVNDVSFNVLPGQFFTLLGPSGCGKTTILRMIAGLETPDSGSVAIGGRRVFCSEKPIDVPANRRNLGMVFQSYAIWPHMTVRGNVAYPLIARKEMLNLTRVEISERADKALDIVDLSGMEDRSPTTLSGGQQQRLALARAIISEPDVILLDEPLSNLDARLRDRMRQELRRLQRETGLTMVYVTHDQSEALALSDVIAVMNKGRILQCGAPRTVYLEPLSETVARFVGKGNFVHGRIVTPGGNGTGPVFRSALGDFALDSPVSGEAGGDALIVIRPEDIELRKGAPLLPGSLPARIVNLEYQGPVQEVTVSAAGTELLVHAPASGDYSIGDDVRVLIETGKIRLVDRTDG